MGSPKSTCHDSNLKYQRLKLGNGLVKNESSNIYPPKDSYIEPEVMMAVWKMIFLLFPGGPYSQVPC